jgi:hypothetical protein
VLDRSVLAGRIHRLEHKEQRPAFLGVEHVLLLCEPDGATLQQVSRLALVRPHYQATCVAWIEVDQFEAIAFCDAEWMDVFLDAVNDLFSRHGSNSLL